MSAYGPKQISTANMARFDAWWVRKTGKVHNRCASVALLMLWLLLFSNLMWGVWWYRCSH